MELRLPTDPASGMDSSADLTRDQMRAIEQTMLRDLLRLNSLREMMQSLDFPTGDEIRVAVEASWQATHALHFELHRERVPDAAGEITALPMPAAASADHR